MMRSGLSSLLEAGHALAIHEVAAEHQRAENYDGHRRPGLDAATALDWGIVERVVSPECLDAAIEEWVAAIVESGPRAIRLQKELIREWEAMPVNDAIQAGIRMIGRAYETDEPHRMVAAARARLRARKST